MRRLLLGLFLATLLFPATSQLLQAQVALPAISCDADNEFPATSMNLLLDATLMSSPPTVQNDCSHTEKDGRVTLQVMTVSCGATTITSKISLQKTANWIGVDPNFTVITKCWPSGGTHTFIAYGRLDCNNLTLEVQISVQNAQMTENDRTAFAPGCQLVPIPKGNAVG